jgi:hypothetical protein
MPKKEPNKELKVVTFTMQEIWAASRHIIQKNKKKYNRKDSNNKGPYYILCK